MQAEITVRVEYSKLGAVTLRQVADLLEKQELSDTSVLTDVEIKDPVAAEAPKKGRGRPKKEAAPAVAESEELEVQTAPAAEDDDLSFDEPAKPAPLKSAPTLDGDILPAFRDYAKKHTREKALAILTKLGVKNPREIPADKYEKVLKFLRA